jgi:Spy/CpxP family protein refolding chaperone
MLKSKNLLLTFMVIVVSALGVAAQGNLPPDERPPKNDEPRGKIISRVLELTEDQRIAISSINKNQRKELRRAQNELKAAREAADLAIYNDVFDEADVTAKVRRVAQAQATITGIRLRSEVAVRGVLTPVQLVKFRELRARFKNQRRRMERRRKLNQRPRNRPNGQRRNNPPPPRNRRL